MTTPDTDCSRCPHGQTTDGAFFCRAGQTPGDCRLPARKEKKD